MADDLIALDDAIEETVRDQVWSEAVRAFQCLAFTYGGRATETITKLTWNSHVHDESVAQLVWPAGCKYQDVDVRLVRSREVLDHPALDPVARLEALRTALREAGIEPRPDDPIFPLVDAGDAGDGGDGTIIPNPVGALLDDPTFEPDLPPLARQGRAERRVVQRYRHAWTVIAEDVLEGLRGQRRVAPHGLRRATMAALVAAERSELEIRHEMRHGNFATSMRYLDGRVLPVLDSYELLEELDHGRLPALGQATIDRLEALDVAEDADDGDPAEFGELPVLDWVCSAPMPDGEICGRLRTGDLWSHLTENGTWHVYCTDHLAALLEHRPDWLGALPTCEAGDCDVYRLLSRCELPDGSTLRVCTGHHGRAARAMRDGTWEDGQWMRPFEQPLGEGTPCAGDCTYRHSPLTPLQPMTADDATVLVCQSHARRIRAADPEWSRELWRPIGDGEPCVGAGCTRTWGTGHLMKRAPGIGVLCSTGHYARWLRNPHTWNKPLREVKAKRRDRDPAPRKAKKNSLAIDADEPCAATGCTRTRTAGYKMKRAPGIGVLCSTGHYARWLRNPDSWDEQLQAVRRRDR